MLEVRLDPNACYLASPVIGLIAGPPFSLGVSHGCILIRLSVFDDEIRQSLATTLALSFQSWGLGDGKSLPIMDPILLFMKLSGSEPDSVRGGVTAGDLALSILRKKLKFGHASFIAWNRLSGRAIGALYKGGSWSPIERDQGHVTPAIVQQPPLDLWDSFLSDFLSDKLDVLGKALANNLLWERAARSAVDDTHRFLFVWIAIESTMPAGERDEGSFVRRLALIAGSASWSGLTDYHGRSDNEGHL